MVWTDESGQSGEVAERKGDSGASEGNPLRPPPPAYENTSHRRKLQRQIATLDPPVSPNTEITHSSSSPSSLQSTPRYVQYDGSSSQEEDLKKHYLSVDSESHSEWSSDSSLNLRRLSASIETSRSNCESCEKTAGSDVSDHKCDVTMAAGSSPGMVRSGDEVDLLVSSQESYDGPVSGQFKTLSRNQKPDRTRNTWKSERTRSESDLPSDDNRKENPRTMNSRSVSADHATHERPRLETLDKDQDASEERADPVTHEEYDSSEDENDPFGLEKMRAMQEAMKGMRPMPIIEKMGNSTENLHQLFSKHLPSPEKYAVLPEKDYKEQRTNEPGQRMLSSGEENVYQGNMSDSRGQTLKRLNSDSSVSSTSSDARWSESDPQESPRPKLGGILNTGKKSGDGKKSKSDKHISFAADVADNDHQTSRNSISKRRDLSPIYEAPDLLRSSKGDNAMRQQYHHSGGSSTTSRCASPAKTLEERLYRLFSYSSDDDYESSCNSEEGSVGGGHVARRDQHKTGMIIPQGLVS